MSGNSLIERNSLHSSIFLPFFCRMSHYFLFSLHIVRKSKGEHSMKAIVSGGAGFIGSHLVDALILKGIEVHILDNLVSGQLEQVNPNAHLHVVDICSEEAKKIVLDIRPDTFFHLAAQADVGKSVQNPSYDADVKLSALLIC